VQIPAGAVVRHEDQAIVAIGALCARGRRVLDHIVTFPRARRRGHERATTRAVGEAYAAGAERVYLLAEPEETGATVRRLGFATVTQIAS
jgi:hypothetical protein